jgi:uncharacterized Fe-S cluster protein YjdI
MKRSYSNNDITVYWDSKLCQHAGHCFRSLPNVFRPAKRPWINIDGADPEEIKRIVNKCPSGAITCKINDHRR